MHFILKQYHNIAERFSIVGELIQFFWEQKLWWLIPFVFILIVFGILFVFAQSSPLAPFLYTLF